MVETIDYESLVLNRKNFLGSGKFSKAYRIDNDNVILTSNDMVKECISLFCQEESVHIPKIKKVGYHKKSQSYLYCMPFYEKLQAKNRQAWKDFRSLEKFRGELMKKSFKDFESLEYSTDFIENYEGLRPEIKSAIFTLAENLRNYTEKACFEFSPRNLKIDSQENLILLDVLFLPYT